MGSHMESGWNEVWHLLLQQNDGLWSLMCRRAGGPSGWKFKTEPLFTKNRNYKISYHLVIIFNLLTEAHLLKISLLLVKI